MRRHVNFFSYRRVRKNVFSTVLQQFVSQYIQIISHIFSGWPIYLVLAKQILTISFTPSPFLSLKLCQRFFQKFVNVIDKTGKSLYGKPCIRLISYNKCTEKWLTLRTIGHIGNIYVHEYGLKILVRNINQKLMQQAPIKKEYPLLSWYVPLQQLSLDIYMAINCFSLQL